jgi:hypothetical protein
VRYASTAAALEAEPQRPARRACSADAAEPADGVEQALGGRRGHQYEIQVPHQLAAPAHAPRNGHTIDARHAGQGRADRVGVPPRVVHEQHARLLTQEGYAAEHPLGDLGSEPWEPGQAPIPGGALQFLERIHAQVLVDRADLRDTHAADLEQVAKPGDLILQVFEACCGPCRAVRCLDRGRPRPCAAPEFRARARGRPSRWSPGGGLVGADPERTSR